MEKLKLNAIGCQITSGDGGHFRSHIKKHSEEAGVEYETAMSIEDIDKVLMIHPVRSKTMKAWFAFRDKMLQKEAEAEIGAEPETASPEVHEEAHIAEQREFNFKEEPDDNDDISVSFESLTDEELITFIYYARQELIRRDKFDVGEWDVRHRSFNLLSKKPE